MRGSEIYQTKEKNPVIRADYPEPDVIRVGDVYYMLSATRHFLPGGQILRSYDLIHWEIASYVFDTFEGTQEARMTNERSNYGYGMWAGSLCYHKDRFYVSFAAKETSKTYFYSSKSIDGPWESHHIDFYFHQGALFFDDDDRVYLIFGQKELWIREMLPDLSGMKPDGFHRKLLSEQESDWTGFEGSHFYKLDNRYYLFTACSPAEHQDQKVQMVFCADSLTGGWKGEEVFQDDLGYLGESIYQGGLVFDLYGHAYSMMMQNRGAVGRVPVLVPVTSKDGRLQFGKAGRAPQNLLTESNRPHYEYEPLYTSDEFLYTGEEDYHLKPQWQWNHEPNHKLWKIDEQDGLKITTGKLSANITQAVNTLTQRLFYPKCAVEVTVDAEKIREGDYAGICALQGCYSMVAITRELSRYYLVVLKRDSKVQRFKISSMDYLPGTLTDRVSLSDSVVKLKMEVDFHKEIDKVSFFYKECAENKTWKRIGKAHKLYFGTDHDMGCRCGLGMFSTMKSGGSAVFRNFKYKLED